MSKVIVGIISFFGHTPETRKQRRKIHNFQLRWFRNQGFTKDEIIVASQYYNDDEYKRNYATYWDCQFPNSKLKPGSARNFLLKEFYNSDADWFILADNDSVLDFRDDTRHKGNIMQWLKDNDQNEVPCFVPVAPNVPGQGAWKDFFKERAEDLDKNWIFERGKTKTSFMFLKNFKKHYGFEQYFDEGERFTSGEDWAFGIDLIMKGYRAMWCRNIILREMGGMKHAGTWKSAGDTRGHSDFQPLLREDFAKAYGSVGIVNATLKNGKCQMQMKEFYKRFPITNNEIMVPKDGLGVVKEEGNELFEF